MKRINIKNNDSRKADRRGQMKKTAITSVWAVCFVLFLVTAGAAAPYTVEFEDTVHYWDTWSSGKNRIDNKDVIGNPNISGGNVVISEDGYLQAVNFNYSAQNPRRIPVGDLFIDIGADQSWDYVLSTSGQNYVSDTPSFNYSFNEKYAGVIYGFESGFSAQKGVNDDYYLTTPDRGWLRQNHPMALSDYGAQQGHIVDSEVYFADGFYYWVPDPGEDEKVVDFSGFSLDLMGQDFIIGFGPDCANDAIYAVVNNPVPVPPSLLLMGSGLVGLLGYRRKKARK